MIPMLNLKRQYAKLEKEILQSVSDVFSSGAFINGQPVRELEKELAAAIGTKHGIACASGTDALQLALMAIGIQPGDEIITTPFTFIATAEVISLLQAKPVYVDICPDTLLMDLTKVEAAITEKTKAIIPVHLFGQGVNMPELMQIAEKHNLKVIEDNAQSLYGRFNDQGLGSFGDVSTTSFYPAKNLGAFGDGGMLFTSNDELATTIRGIADHGSFERYVHKLVGINSRLDTVQAAILRIKNRHMPEWCEHRNQVAQKYIQAFSDLPIEVPVTNPGSTHVYHQFTIQTDKRDELKQHLMDNGIGCAVHYPAPLHRQPVYAADYNTGDFPVSERASQRVLSLPICSDINEAETDEVIRVVRQFF